MELPTLMPKAGAWSTQHPLWGHSSGPFPQPRLPLLQQLRASSLCLGLRSDPDGFRGPGCPFPGASPVLSISSLFFGSSVERDSCVRRAPGYKGHRQGEGRSSWLEGECWLRGARAEGAPMGPPSCCRVSKSHAEFLRTRSRLGETYLRAGCVTPSFLL